MRPLNNHLWLHLVVSESLNVHSINYAYYDLKYPEEDKAFFIYFVEGSLWYVLESSPAKEVKMK